MSKATRGSRRSALIGAVLFAVALIGCGYKTAGKSTQLPQSLHTIAIPGFANQTRTYRIEQVLTGAVVREFAARTNYRVLNQQSGDADAVLHGTVVGADLAPITYDSRTGRASSGLVTLTMRVSLVDRQGKVLFENQNYQFREQYQISREITSFFEEDSPAVDRMSREFARTLVSNIVEAY